MFAYIRRDGLIECMITEVENPACNQVVDSLPYESRRDFYGKRFEMEDDVWSASCKAGFLSDEMEKVGIAMKASYLREVTRLELVFIKPKPEPKSKAKRADGEYTGQWSKSGPIYSGSASGPGVSQVASIRMDIDDAISGYAGGAFNLGGTSHRIAQAINSLIDNQEKRRALEYLAAANPDIYRACLCHFLYDTPTVRTPSGYLRDCQEVHNTIVPQSAQAAMRFDTRIRAIISVLETYSFDHMCRTLQALHMVDSEQVRAIQVLSENSPTSRISVAAVWTEVLMTAAFNAGVVDRVWEGASAPARAAGSIMRGLMSPDTGQPMADGPAPSPLPMPFRPMGASFGNPRRG